MRFRPVACLFPLLPGLPFLRSGVPSFFNRGVLAIWGRSLPSGAGLFVVVMVYRSPFVVVGIGGAATCQQVKKAQISSNLAVMLDYLPFSPLFSLIDCDYQSNCSEYTSICKNEKIIS